MIDHIRKGTRTAFLASSVIQLLLLLLISTHAISPFPPLVLVTLMVLFVLTSGVIFLMTFLFRQWRAAESYLLISTIVLVLGEGAVVRVFPDLLLFSGFLFMVLVLMNIFVISMTRERRQQPLTSYFPAQTRTPRSAQTTLSSQSSARPFVPMDDLIEEFIPVEDVTPDAGTAGISPRPLESAPTIDLFPSAEPRLQDRKLQQILMQEREAQRARPLHPSLEDVKEAEREVELLREGAVLEKAEAQAQQLVGLDEKAREKDTVREAKRQARILEQAGAQMARAQKEMEQISTLEAKKSMQGEARALEAAQRRIQEAEHRIAKAKVSGAREEAKILERASRQASRIQRDEDKRLVKETLKGAKQLAAATRTLGKAQRQQRSKGTNAQRQIAAMSQAFNALNKAAADAKKRKILDEKRSKEKNLNMLIKEAAKATVNRKGAKQSKAKRSEAKKKSKKPRSSKTTTVRIIETKTRKVIKKK